MKTTNLLGLALLGALTAAPAIRLSAEDVKTTSAATATGAEEGFQSLFDGTDLSKWEGEKKFWSAKDGTIQGQTTAENPTSGNTFLIYKGGPVADFELRFSYKIVGGNSGVQYRSKVLNPEKFAVGGYQADFEAGKTFSGILYDESGVAGNRGVMANRGEKVTYPAKGEKKVEKLPMTTEQLQAAIKDGDWNEYVIVAKGSHLIHKINGNTTAEVIDESDKALKEGVLALQLHAGPPMLVQFKNIRMKKL